MTLKLSHKDAAEEFIDAIDSATHAELNALSLHVEKLIERARPSARPVMKDVKRVIDNQRRKF